MKTKEQILEEHLKYSSATPIDKAQYHFIELAMEDYYKQKLDEMMPKWKNIDDNDFIAEINSYVLRVEQMDTSIWWYSVSKGKLELCNETNAGSEEQAKLFAEGVYLRNYLKLSLKNNKKYPIGGFAPGNYRNKCVTCGEYFIGDKLALQCETCAIKITQEEEE